MSVMFNEVRRPTIVLICFTHEVTKLKVVKLASMLLVKYGYGTGYAISSNNPKAQKGINNSVDHSRKFPMTVTYLK